MRRIEKAHESIASHAPGNAIRILAGESAPKKALIIEVMQIMLLCDPEDMMTIKNYIQENKS